MESLTIKVDEEMAREMDKAMKPLYATKTEFIREAIRDKLKILQKERRLEQYLGFAKKKITQEDEEKVRKKVGDAIMTELGM